MLPSCRHDQHQAGNHAEAGPTVGEDVLAVGLKDQRVIAPADAQQIPPEYRIQRAGGDDQNHAAAQVSKRQAVPPFLRGRVNNASRGEDDHRAFKARGKEGDALVSVVEIVERPAAC